MRLAKMSFDLWGALSPQNSRPPPGSEDNKETSDVREKEEAEQLNKRSMSQAELESSLFKVRV